MLNKNKLQKNYQNFSKIEIKFEEFFMPLKDFQQKLKQTQKGGDTVSKIYTLLIHWKHFGHTLDTLLMQCLSPLDTIFFRMN